jgi:acetyl-CoA synthetase
VKRCVVNDLVHEVEGLRPSRAHERASVIHADFDAEGASAPWLVCDRHPLDAVAFRFVDDELRVTDMTYGELATRSRRAAHVLAEHGVGPGDRVASLFAKSPDLPAVILGIWRLGAVYVPLFTAFAASAVHDRINDAAVALVGPVGPGPDGRHQTRSARRPGCRSQFSAACGTGVDLTAVARRSADAHRPDGDLRNHR